MLTALCCPPWGGRRAPPPSSLLTPLPAENRATSANAPGPKPAVVVGPPPLMRGGAPSHAPPPPPPRLSAKTATSPACQMPTARGVPRQPAVDRRHCHCHHHSCHHDMSSVVLAGAEKQADAPNAANGVSANVTNAAGFHAQVTTRLRTQWSYPVPPCPA
jgi:hypothetical protein